MIQTSTMNFIFKLAILLTVSSFTASKRSDKKLEFKPLEIVKYIKTDPPNSSMPIYMKRISNSFLANSNIPVWVINSENSIDRVSIDEVMGNIGRFDFYSDVESSSAAVIFRKTGTLMGTIGTKVVQDNIPLNILENRTLIAKLNDRLVKEVSNLNKEKAQRIINHSPTENSEIMYIEILVIVNYDVAKEFENYADLVSDILVGFNSVDMLFSKVEKPKIKLNIAGIAIASEKKSLPELIENQCYELIRGPQPEKFDASCVLKTIQEFLPKYEEFFPFSSYDIVVFLTNHDLNSYESLPNNDIMLRKVYGMTRNPIYKDSNRYRLNHRDLRLSIVQYLDHYKWFPILAHELAHLFNAQHDEQEFDKESDECTGTIMKTGGDFCRKCLRFSNSSIEEMKNFFNSPEGCIFRNKPVSLNFPRKPTLKWSRDEQCQCYGFSRAGKDSIWRELQYYIEDFYSTNLCTSRIVCFNESINSEEEAGLFMDNTDCGLTKVCFQGKCQRLVTT